MTPESFLNKYVYVMRIEFDLEYHRCFFFTNEPNSEEKTAREFNGKSYTDAKAVDNWCVKNCIESKSWDR
jgi:hypothetical protein